jgi:hypothetical protein
MLFSSFFVCWRCEFQEEEKAKGTMIIKTLSTTKTHFFAINSKKKMLFGEER